MQWLTGDILSCDLADIRKKQSKLLVQINQSELINILTSFMELAFISELSVEVLHTHCSAVKLCLLYLASNLRLLKWEESLDKVVYLLLKALYNLSRNIRFPTMW